MILSVKFPPGKDLSDAFDEALGLAIKLQLNVEFNFNHLVCLVRPNDVKLFFITNYWLHLADLYTLPAYYLTANKPPKFDEVKEVRAKFISKEKKSISYPFEAIPGNTYHFHVLISKKVNVIFKYCGPKDDRIDPFLNATFEPEDWEIIDYKE